MMASFLLWVFKLSSFRSTLTRGQRNLNFSAKDADGIDRKMHGWIIQAFARLEAEALLVDGRRYLRHTPAVTHDVARNHEGFTERVEVGERGEQTVVRANDRNLLALHERRHTGARHHVVDRTDLVPLELFAARSLARHQLLNGRAH